MMQALLVAAGGAVGSVARYYVGVWGVRLAGPGFPFGTLTVNVVGCFLIGLLTELISRRFGGSPELRLLLVTGFVGGFTTFSTFALDAVALFERGEATSAVAYLVASFVVSFAALLAGLALMRALG